MYFDFQFSLRFVPEGILDNKSALTIKCLVAVQVIYRRIMMTSSNGNIFRVAGHLCGEFTGPRWIPHTKASDAELWYFLWICVGLNGWVNNRETGDLRPYRAHYDVIVIIYGSLGLNKWSTMLQLDTLEGNEVCFLHYCCILVELNALLLSNQITLIRGSRIK